MKNNKTMNNNFLKYLIVLSLIVFFKSIYSQTPVPYLKLNGKYIYVDSATLEPLISKEYDLAFGFYDSLAWVVRNNKFGLIKTDGKEIFTPKYYRIKILSDCHWPAKEYKYDINRLWFRNTDAERKNGEVFVPLMPFLLNLKNGVAFVSDSLNKWALIDNLGNELTPFIYDELRSTDYNFISYKKNNATGYLNFSGKKIFNNYNIYKGFDQCGCGMACVVNNGKYGYIDTSGKLKIPYKYSDDGYFCNDVLVRQYYQNGNWRYSIVNKNGKEIKLAEYSYVLNSSNGFIKFKRELEFEGALRSEWGLLNNLGTPLMSKTYKEIWPGGENYCPVRSFDDKFGIIDKEGNEIIPPIYNYILHKDYGFKCDYFPPDKSAIKRINFNDKGNELPKLDSTEIQCVFRKKNPDEIVYKFIKFSNLNHYGLLDNNGVVILNPIYDYIGELRFGFAWISKDNKWGVVDSLGNIVTPLDLEYKDFGNFENGFSWVTSNSYNYFLVNYTGKEYREK